MKLTSRFLLENSAAVLALFLGLTSTSFAGPSLPPPAIAWSSMGTITADTDVNTAGSLVAAYRLGPAGIATTMVNGVSFAPFEFPNNGSKTVTVGVTVPFNFTESSSTYALLPFMQGTPAGLSPNYQTLLGSYGAAGDPKTLTLSMTGLTDGHTYLFQWWSNDSLAGTNTSTTATALSDTTSATLFHNPSNTNGALGQYVTGTFTLSGWTSIYIDFIGNGGGLPTINAVQLRDISAIPEPSTWAAIVGVAMFGAAAIRRRKAM